ncbi:MAG: OPT/YSL family transporter [Deltaproteobacteria bacterium]|nr:OPT/YSL family transporter [Deltaproteobacteria bacterium]
MGIITAGGLAALLAGGGVFRRTLDLFRKSPASRKAKTPGTVPRTWWIGGLAAASAGTSCAAWFAFGVPVWQSLVAIVLALPIAAVAIRAVGETDMSPSNNLAKVTQFVFAGLAPGQTVANVAAAGVASGCAIEASEVMTDLKSGAILKNRPRDQFIAQFVGILVATGAAVAAYSLLIAVVPIGDDTFPAPTAVAWKTLADGLAGGRSGIPTGAATAAWIAAAAGVLIGVPLAMKKSLPLPSPVAIGLGVIFPPAYSITILLGAVTAALLSKYAKAFWERDQYLLTSGLIVGESLTGLLAAALMLVGLL